MKRWKYKYCNKESLNENWNILEFLIEKEAFSIITFFTRANLY